MNNPGHEKWSRLWRAVGCRGDSRPGYEHLARNYSEPQRHYHNFRHIAECLEMFDSARQLAEQPLAVEMAIWFHDAVYDPRAPDNEEQSAALARQCLSAAGAGNRFVETVSSLVLATKSHDASRERNASVLVDVDLGIFGQSETRFQEYETQIRKEYSWVPITTFTSRRAEILERFLGRKRIYTTDFFHEKFEQQARSNLQRSLRRLGSMIA